MMNVILNAVGCLYSLRREYLNSDCMRKIGKNFMDQNHKGS